MARVCNFCCKRPLSGNKVSHSNRKSRIRWLPNLKKVKALIKGSAQTVYVCSRCIRSGLVQKPSVRTWKPPAAPAQT